MYKYLKCLETAFAQLSLGKVENVSRKWNGGREQTCMALNLTINGRTRLLWLSLIALFFFSWKVIINLWCFCGGLAWSASQCLQHIESYLILALCIYDCLFYRMRRNKCFIKYYRCLKKFNELDVPTYFRTCRKTHPFQHSKQGIDQTVLCDDEGKQNVGKEQEEKSSL